MQAEIEKFEKLDLDVAKRAVKIWRKNFGLNIGVYGEKNTKEDVDLANRLIREELDEYLEAVSNDDKVGQVDALADLFFVIVQKECVDSWFADTRMEEYKHEPNISTVVEELLRHPKHKSRYLDCYKTIAKKLGVCFLSAITEVFNSNMSKACTTKEEAQQTVEKYKSEGVDTYVKKYNTYFVVKRKGDGKVLKSINFKEPDLKEFACYIN